MSIARLRLLRERTDRSTLPIAGAELSAGMIVEEDEEAVVRAPRRLFLPVAASFARKLNVSNDALSVGSLDERRYSDVPSLRSIPWGSARANPVRVSAAAVAAAPTPPPPPTAAARNRSHLLPSPFVAASRLQALPSTTATQAKSAPSPAAKSRRRPWHRFLQRGGGGGGNENEDSRPLRWAALTTCLPRKSMRTRRYERVEAPSDRPRSSVHHAPDCAHVAADASYARLPMSHAPCSSCGAPSAATAADSFAEPHSFGGFRAKPWYSFPEGSSVSSGEWDQAGNRSSGDSRSRARS